MRYTIGDVVRPRGRDRDPLRERLSGWWIELPARRRWWWRDLLLEDGQGWLRWRPVTHFAEGGWYDAPEPYTVAPPARRLWWTIDAALHGHVRGARECWRSLVDDDRRQQQWGRGGRRG